MVTAASCHAGHDCLLGCAFLKVQVASHPLRSTWEGVLVSNSDSWVSFQTSKADSLEVGPRNPHFNGHSQGSLTNATV